MTPDQVAKLYAAALSSDALAQMSLVVRECLEVDSVGLWLSRDGAFESIAVTDDIAASVGPYFDYYARLDPWGGATPQIMDRAKLSSEHHDEAALLKSEFYNDFARHYGILRPLGYAFALPGGATASLSTNRASNRHLFEAADKPVIEIVGAHLRGALDLHLKVRGQAAASTRMLDALRCAAIVCDRDGRVVDANEAALALDGCGLRLGNRAQPIAASNGDETNRLLALVRGATEGEHGAMRVAGPGRLRIAVVASPLPHDDRAGLLADRALLTLSRSDAAPSLTAAMLRQLFALSAAQAELCLQLAAGSTFEEAAERQAIAVSTARTHFRTILARTGTRNLRDLLRLLATLPPGGIATRR